MGILPDKINESKNSIYPTSEMISTILPKKCDCLDSKILSTEIKVTQEKTSRNSGVITVLSVIMVCILIVTAISYISFKTTFEDEGSRHESGGGTYYELVLEIENGEIEYIFDSWLVTDTITTFEYIIIAPGYIVIDNDWDNIIKVEFVDGDMMKMQPAITSSDSSEYWFK